MSDRHRDKLEEIIKREHPGARISEHSQYESIPGLDTPFDAPDFESADLDSLRHRYFGDELDSGDAEASAPVELDDMDQPEQEFVDVEFDMGAGQTLRKTVVISPEDDEIIGEQG